jgi:hypothetical protein
MSNIGFVISELGVLGTSLALNLHHMEISINFHDDNEQLFFDLKNILTPNLGVITNTDDIKNHALTYLTDSSAVDISIRGETIDSMPISFELYQNISNVISVQLQHIQTGAMFFYSGIMIPEIQFHDATDTESFGVHLQSLEGYVMNPHDATRNNMIEISIEEMEVGNHNGDEPFFTKDKDYISSFLHSNHSLFQYSVSEVGVNSLYPVKIELNPVVSGMGGDVEYVYIFGVML